tara:strand:+ start:651 stop:854 length:204 start_codon:yes stop_codon:yes gene_type:complete
MLSTDADIQFFNSLSEDQKKKEKKQNKAKTSKNYKFFFNFDSKISFILFLSSFPAEFNLIRVINWFH